MGLVLASGCGAGEGVPSAPGPPVTEARLVVELGEDEGLGPQYLFASISSVALDGEGRIYVTDPTTSEVRVFDREGTFVRTIGREGEGPGEFQVPVEVGFGADGSLWVRDIRRIQQFATRVPGAVPDSVVRIHRLTGYGNLDPVRGAISDSFYHSPGNFFPLAGGATYFYEVFGPDGVQDTVPVPAFENLERVPPARYRGRTTPAERAAIATLSRAPFEAQPQWEMTRRGTLLVSTGGEGRVRELRLEDGAVLREFPLPDPRLPVPPQERSDSAAALEARRSQVSAPLDEIAFLSPHVRQGTLPDSLPTVVEIHEGVDGSVWVQVWPEQPGETRYLRFDAQGELLSSLRVPVALARVPPYFTATHLAGVVVDPATGVQRVVVLGFGSDG